MNRSPEFSFDTIMDRESGTTEIRVVCRIENYAKSVGFDEPCKYRDVSIIRTEYKGLPLTDDEMAYLHNEAVGQLSYH